MFRSWTWFLYLLTMRIFHRKWYLYHDSGSILTFHHDFTMNLAAIWGWFPSNQPWFQASVGRSDSTPRVPPLPGTFSDPPRPGDSRRPPFRNTCFPCNNPPREKQHPTEMKATSSYQQINNVLFFGGSAIDTRSYLLPIRWGIWGTPSWKSCIWHQQQNMWRKLAGHSNPTTGWQWRSVIWPFKFSGHAMSLQFS